MPEPRSDQEIRDDVARHNALAAVPGYHPEQDDVDDRLACDVEPLLAERDARIAAEARVAEVEAVLAAQLGDCIGCTDEPEEFCPRHGRSYANVLNILDDIAAERVAAEARAVKAERELDVARAKIRQVETARCWTNEDGKRFVFADDILAALAEPVPIETGVLPMAMMGPFDD